MLIMGFVILNNCLKSYWKQVDLRLADGFSFYVESAENEE
jgi:hypothetical protein